MTIFKQSLMDTLYFGCEADEGHPCEVRISSGEIVVDYISDGERVLYRGIDNGSGHYQLDCPEVDGRATLHRLSPNSSILEGSWLEGVNRGMWKIHLSE